MKVGLDTGSFSVASKPGDPGTNKRMALSGSVMCLKSTEAPPNNGRTCGPPRFEVSAVRSSELRMRLRPRPRLVKLDLRPVVEVAVEGVGVVDAAAAVDDVVAVVVAAV